MSVLLEALLPIAAVVVLGAIAQRALALDLPTLSQLSVYVLVPALLGDRLYRTELPLGSAVRIVLAFVLAAAAMYGVARLVARGCGFSPEVTRGLCATTVFGNVGNLGLPFNAFAFGEAGLERAAICLVASALLLFGLGPLVYQSGGFGAGLRTVLKLPLIYAAIAGVGLRAAGVELPDTLASTLTRLGDAAIPIALLMLGMQLAKTAFAMGGYEAIATGLRLVAAPGVAWAIGWGVGLRGLDLQVLVAQCAMPAAVNTVVLTVEFGGDAARVARTVAVSTVLALLTLPLLLELLG